MAFKMPARPTPKDTNVPFVGPYQQNQAQAELLWQQTQAQLAAQRGQTLNQFGYRPTTDGSGMEVDPNNPYGEYQQMLRSSQQESDQLNTGMHNRGFTGEGFAAQAETTGQYDHGARSNSLAQALLARQQDLNTQQLQGQSNFNNSTLQNQLGSTEYAIQNGLFNPHGNLRTNAQTTALVNNMRKQWLKRYGGLNKKGMAGTTFQGRINQLGSRLYDKDKTLTLGGKKWR